MFSPKNRLILLFLFISQFTYAQTTSCYEQLNNATGLVNNPTQLAMLDSLACELKDMFNYEVPEGITVAEFGFYQHQRSYSGGLPEALQLQKDLLEQNAENYFLFGNEISPNTGEIKLWIIFEFNTEGYPCLDEATLNSVLQSQAGGQGTPFQAYEYKKTVLSSLRSRLFEGFCCSAYNNANELWKEEDIIRLPSDEEVCVDYAKIDAAFNALLDDPVYVDFLYKIDKIYQFYDQCSSQNWQAGAKDGIIPKCIWEESNVSILDFYTPSDLPFVYGGVDGVYSEAKGIVDLLLSLDDIAGGMANLAYSYTVWYLVCEKNVEKPNKLELQIILQNLNDASWSTPSMADTFNDFFDQFGSSLLSAEDLFELLTGNNCDDLEATRNTVEKIYEAISDLDTWVWFYDQIIQEASELWENINGFSNEERYHQGYYGVKVAIAIATEGGTLLTKGKYLDELGDYLASVLAAVKQRKGSFTEGVRRNLVAALTKKMKDKLPFKNWFLGKRTKFFNDFSGDYDILRKL